MLSLTMVLGICNIMLSLTMVLGICNLMLSLTMVLGICNGMLSLTTMEMSKQSYNFTYLQNVVYLS